MSLLIDPAGPSFTIIFTSILSFLPREAVVGIDSKGESGHLFGRKLNDGPANNPSSFWRIFLVVTFGHPNNIAILVVLYELAC